MVPPDTPMNTSAPASASVTDPGFAQSEVLLAEPLLDLGEVAARRMDDALAVDDRDLADAGGAQHAGDRDAGRAGAGDDDLEVVELAIGEPDGVEQRGQHDDRGAVLVVVEDGDVEPLDEAPLDLEAAGAEMSSRLMPPNVGARRMTVSTISSASVVARATGIASTPPNCLNRTALPSITGIEAAGPMSPRPSTAVPSVTTATVLETQVYSWAASGSATIASQTRATPGVYDMREVVRIAQRHR